jgi:hypothetical protein
MTYYDMTLTIKGETTSNNIRHGYDRVILLYDINIADIERMVEEFEHDAKEYLRHNALRSGDKFPRLESLKVESSYTLAPSL